MVARLTAQRWLGKGAGRRPYVPGEARYCSVAENSAEPATAPLMLLPS